MGRKNALQRYREEKPKGQTSGSKGANQTSSSSLPQTTDVVATDAPDVGSLTVDLEFYQKKSSKLSEENDSLRKQIFNLENELRRVQAYVEEQEHRLRLAEVHKRSTVK